MYLPFPFLQKIGTDHTITDSSRGTPSPYSIFPKDNNEFKEINPIDTSLRFHSNETCS